MSVRRVFSGAPWEEKVAYCRAIRAGSTIHVTGTVAVDGEGNPFAPGDAYAQTRRALEIILQALGELGAGVEHVVRTRMYLTDIRCWPEVGRAHRELFADHPPATTLVEVSALIHPDLVVEVEADAIVSGR